MTTALSHQKAINKQASEFVVRLYSGELTAKEEERIICWCEENEFHQQAFDQALSLWDMSAELSPHVGWRQKLEKRFYHLRYLAASILVFMFSFMLFFNTTSIDTSVQPQLPSTYRTAIGEISSVGLPDGSTISLNTNTQINVEFNDNYRELWLQTGEAFFDIAKDPSRPFLIHTGTKTVRVVGTKFNIKLSQSGFDIAVAEGIVAVEESAKSGSNQQVEKSEGVFLEAGAIASFNNSNAIIAKKNEVTVEKAQSWRTGYLRFDDERLEKVIASFNRYRTKKIEIDDKLAHLRISGVFKLSDGDAILTALEATLPIEAQIDTDRIILLKK
ncbi:FecR domain-containing protein [Aliiglaciecola sp. 3_MG-2023]|uniref:FecR family protein n=1 Tax=Aliiglaciecola sp. 3_MG-2023 TaxID=3062644 RepID=UPI0026E18AA9|nr:FecR domain-containing protein [Aliiglaciecola sp. 3_MG-2023]MDO6693193.1 FecR domain-containing protein [Aliiglaciecola sp. 3_MG-2023]